MNPAASSESATPIADARRRHRLADIAVRTGIPLMATTGSVTVRCPMPNHGHPDRTPSMRLFLDDDHFYCFGCHARGDVIQWVRSTNSLSVRDAIRLLDSGQPILNAWVARSDAEWRPRRSGPSDGPDQGRTPRHEVLAVLEAAWGCYSTGEGHRVGASYLASRGIDIAVLEHFTGRPEVGHTLPGFRGLVELLRADGFTADQLVDAGLVRRAVESGHTIDAYRQRVLVPVRTENGDVCGLVGRSVGRTDAPKYLNPPRTVVYDKSLNLYSPLPAPPNRRGTAVVVEGTLDALAVATAALRAGLSGWLWPVTQSGRELSGPQIERILTLTAGPPLLALDADTAGREATERLSRAFAARNRTTTKARLPEGHDPASWLSAACGSSRQATRVALATLTGVDAPWLRSSWRLSSATDPAPLIVPEVGL